jgi:hypothetical protein
MHDISVDKSSLLQGLDVTQLHPAIFHRALTDERLRVIASALLNIRHETLTALSSPYDDNYTRESTVFGRQRNLLIEMALGQEHDWMTLAHAGMDVTFCVDSVPCRFFTDDSEAPRKDGFFKRNAVDSLFASDDRLPVMWRFVVEPAISDDGEDRVLFIGYNVYHEKVSQWVFRPSLPTLHSIGEEPPAPTRLLAAEIELLDDDFDAGDGQVAKGRG